MASFHLVYFWTFVWLWGTNQCQTVFTWNWLCKMSETLTLTLPQCLCMSMVAVNHPCSWFHTVNIFF